MRKFLAFEGTIGRLAYALISAAIVALPYGIVWLAFAALHKPEPSGWRFWTVPLFALGEIGPLPMPVLPLAFLALLLAYWTLAALAFRRAADAQADGWIATLVVAPGFQVAAILYLSFLPPRPQPATAATPEGGMEWHSAAQGVLTGMALTLFGVAVSTLVFGSYGFGIFVLTPFVIGVATAFLANRVRDIGWRRTHQLTLLALSLGGTALVLVALEGVVCIVLAAPLAYGTALVGALLGRAAAQRPGRRGRSTLTAFVLLPAMFASEQAFPVTTTFATDESIDIAAPPDAVWQSLIHMDRIDIPPSLPFRLGVAYPLRGEIAGSGVGAIRTGVFSTGIALERVTEWRTDRVLAFVVLSDPPAMHEMSPYAHVNAPHVLGYFRTVSTRFEIVPLTGGRSRLVEHTGHALRLDPILYWLPLARWIIHQNNARVLASVRQHAEQAAMARR
ncbi:MAG TPA: hypothetical protein VNU97_10855 [Rhizomicrobium sp.]|jgi:uncharacterized membrane protein YhaH (DUF805 family)|nr:hypothetical protein [Rhizomicrobium sp.]